MERHRKDGIITCKGKGENGDYVRRLNEVVEQLTSPEAYEAVFNRTSHDVPMPSVESLGHIVDLLRTVLFPGYFGNSDLKPGTMRYYLGSSLDRVSLLLAEQINRGLCFSCEDPEALDCAVCEVKARDATMTFLSRLPEIRRLLATDVRSAFEGDPAAKSYGEAIFCYPSITAITNYRIAHELSLLDVPLIPRIISEMAHSSTGIDIHPGASIGDHFFIDHGTGVVIGETCEIGSRVRIYQGVTLGAKSFPLDENGRPIKGIPRHPIVEDDVIIYSGATILGRVTIGRGSEIGGNVWLTHGVPPGTRVFQGRAEEEVFHGGSGI
jgi:serine O-acetyltransferase